MSNEKSLETEEIEETSDELEADEEEAVVESGRLSARVVYEIIRRDGIEELDRPMASLLWSGIAAGLMISFSVLAEAMLRAHLPDTDWRPLVENLGYSTGFLLTILGRMQLFTENTITTVIPLCHRPSMRVFIATLRLWGIVFGANLIGTLISAVFIAYTGVFDAQMLQAVSDLSHHMMDDTTMGMFLRGIPAGILIASIVWMLPSAGSAAVAIITLFTYLIALGDFTHVVAGATEMLYLVVTGELGIVTGIFHFLIPVFLGNVVGGTVVFSMLAYGQVHQEIRETQERKAAEEESAAAHTVG